MIARFHYDEKVLSRLLHDEPSSEDKEVLAHVETCELCQDQLDSLSAGDMTWDEVCDLMRQDDLPDFELADADLTTKPRVTFLEASDVPDSLGRFGRYEILEILGRGGMGIVMHGIDSALERHCAIKVLAPELASSAAARKRFSREARSAAAVVHPYVVPITYHNGKAHWYVRPGKHGVTGNGALLPPELEHLLTLDEKQDQSQPSAPMSNIPGGEYILPRPAVGEGGMPTKRAAEPDVAETAADPDANLSVGSFAIRIRDCQLRRDYVTLASMMNDDLVGDSVTGFMAEVIDVLPRGAEDFSDFRSYRQLETLFASAMGVDREAALNVIESTINRLPRDGQVKPGQRSAEQHLAEGIKNRHQFLGNAYQWFIEHKERGAAIAVPVSRVFVDESRATAINETADYAFILQHQRNGWRISNLWSSDKRSSVRELLKEWPKCLPRKADDTEGLDLAAVGSSDRPSASQQSFRLPEAARRVSESASIVREFDAPEALMTHVADCQSRDDIAGLVACWTDAPVKKFATSYLMSAMMLIGDFQRNPDTSRPPGYAEQIRELQQILSDEIRGHGAARVLDASAWAGYDVSSKAGKDFEKSAEALGNSPLVQLLSRASADMLESPRRFVVRFGKWAKKHREPDEETPKTRKIEYSIEQAPQDDRIDVGKRAVAIDKSSGRRMGLIETEAGWLVNDLWPDADQLADPAGGAMPGDATADLSKMPPVEPLRDWKAGLQGRWEVEMKSYNDDKKLQSITAHALVMGNRITLTGDDEVPVSFAFEFGGDGPPKQIDLRPILTTADEQLLKQGGYWESEAPPETLVNPTFYAIIKESEEGFEFCLPAAPGERPSDFSISTDRGMWIFRRERGAMPTKNDSSAHEGAGAADAMPDTKAEQVLENGRPFPTLKQIAGLTPFDSFGTADGLAPWPRFRFSIHPDGTYGFQARPIKLDELATKLPIEKLMDNGGRIGIEAHVDVPIEDVRKVIEAFDATPELDDVQLHLFECGPETHESGFSGAANESPSQDEASAAPATGVDTSDPRDNHAASAGDQCSKQVILEMTLSEKAAATEGNKVLAEPTLAVTLGRPFAYDAGGDLNTSNSGDGSKIGTHVQGTVKKHTGESFLVELKLVVGNGLIDAGNPETELVKSQTLDLRTIMSSGEKKQFNCGRSRVLKIHLQPMPAAKVESQVRQANTASSQSELSRKPLDVGKPVNVPDVAYGKTESGRSSKSDNDDTQTASTKTFGTPE